MKLLFPIIIALSIVVTACAHPSKSRVTADSKTFASVSVARPSFNPAQGQNFSWYGVPVWADATLAESAGEINQQLIESINSELLSRGYRVTEDLAKANFVIGLAVITGSSELSQTMSNFFRSFPGLPKSAAGFEKGVIAAAVIDIEHFNPSEDVDPDVVLWRSTLEAFILGEKIDASQREQRVKELSSILMRRFP